MAQRIDFTIIGAQKAGTTSLYDYLAQHPDVYLPAEKENLFFSREDLYRRGDAYLRHYYRRYAGERVCGHAYVHLLVIPESAPRMWEYNSAMRLIAVLRNPIDRAYSGYWQARRTGVERCASFEEAIAQEPARLARPPATRVPLAHRARGDYVALLQPFLEQFPRHQIRIVLFEDLIEMTADTVGQVVTWLGLDPEVGGLDFSQPSNPASMPRLPWLQHQALSPSPIIKRVYRTLIPRQAWRHALRERVVRLVNKANLVPFDYPPMKPETRAALRAYYQPGIAQLAGLLGRDLSHWR